MAGTQALDAPRGVSFAFDPADLTLITDPADPLYDARVDDPIPEGAVLDAANRGIVMPIVVRRRGSESVVLDGIQRTKRALVVNALTGTPYRGKIRAVRDAIEALRAKQGDQDSVARQVIALAPKGLRIPAVARNSGNNGDAYGVKTALNEWRHDDPMVRKIAKAQRLAELGRTPADIALDMGGVSLATVRRWLAAEAGDRGPRKTRGKATRPGLGQLKRMAAALNGEAPVAKVLLRWVVGDATAEEVVAVCPELTGKMDSKTP